jgi:hypothetical protein
MTDMDVVELVAAAFGTSLQANDKGRYRTELAATIKGSRAAELMRALRPMMSARRQAAIDRALEGYSAPFRKLDFESAEEIRRRCAAGETVSSLARSFKVARQTVHQILDHPFMPPTIGHLGGRSQGQFVAELQPVPDCPGPSFTGSLAGLRAREAS